MLNLGLAPALLLLLVACEPSTGESGKPQGGPGTRDTADSGDTAEPADSGDTGDPDADGDTWPDSVDCDDSNPAVNPAATEVCNGIDDNCANGLDDEAAVVLYESPGEDPIDVAAEMTGTADSPAQYHVPGPGSYKFCGGTWYVNITGSGELTFEGGGTTTLDGGGIGSVISLSSSDIDVTITGFTIQNGLGSTEFSGRRTGGGGVGCVEDDGDFGFLEIVDTTIKANSASYGGGVLSVECSLRLTHSAVGNNSAEAEGGGVYGTLALATTDSDISGNSAASGGGVSIQPSNAAAVYLTDTWFESNFADEGAAMVIGEFVGVEADATGANTGGFYGNTSDAGGAIVLPGSHLSNWQSGGYSYGPSGTADDNSPADFYFLKEGQSHSLGDNETFTCDENGCDW